MTSERKTMELIDQIEDETGGRISEAHMRRLAELRHLITAGASLTTAERIEVSELWDRYVK